MKISTLFIVALVIAALVSLQHIAIEARHPRYVAIEIVERAGVELHYYPINVVLPSDKIDFSSLAPDCSDLYVVDEEGNPLHYYVYRCDHSEKRVALWIEIPLLKPYEKKRIFIIYGTSNPFKYLNNPREVFTLYEGFEELSPSWNHLGRESRHEIVGGILLFKEVSMDILYTSIPIELENWRISVCGYDLLLHSDADLGIYVSYKDPTKGPVLAIVLNGYLRLDIGVKNDVLDIGYQQLNFTFIGRSPNDRYCIYVEKYGSKLRAEVYSDKVYTVEVKNPFIQKFYLKYVAIGIVDYDPDRVGYDYIAVMPFVEPEPIYGFVKAGSIPTSTVTEYITSIVTKTVEKTVSKTIAITRRAPPVTVTRTATVTERIEIPKTMIVTWSFISTLTKTETLTLKFYNTYTVTVKEPIVVPITIRETVYRTSVSTSMSIHTVTTTLFTSIERTSYRSITKTLTKVKIVPHPVTLTKTETSIVELRYVDTGSISIALIGGIALGIVATYTLSRRGRAIALLKKFRVKIRAMERPRSEAVPVCPFCRRELPRGIDITFCPFCGAYLKQDETTAYTSEEHS